MTRAREAGLDLVEVDANANPPVCRILDYGKFKYEQAKKEREGRKHQRGPLLHEVRMRPRTGQHDIDLKVRIAERLLAEGDKVKLSIMFRGREMSHPEVGHDVLQRALSQLSDAAGVEKPPGMEGRFLSVILTPTVKKPAPVAKAASARGDGSPGDGSSDGGQPNGSPKGRSPKAPPEAKAEAAQEPEPGAAPEPKAPPAAKAEAALEPEAAPEPEPEPAATGSTNES
jgi:translation initiation factor IF-3